MAFAHVPDGYNPTWAYLAIVPTEGGTPRALTGDQAMLAFDGSVGTGMWRYRWMPDGRSLLVTVKTGAFERVEQVTVHGHPELVPTARMRSAQRAEPADDGRLVYYSRDARGARHIRVTTHERGLDHAVIELESGTTGRGHVRQVRWRAPDGLPLTGLVITPRGPAPDRPYPTVVDVHGGPYGGLSPSGSLLNAGPMEWHLWAARGYAVFVADYRSSQIPGRTPHEELVADRELLARDAGDIQAGVRQLISMGIADPARLALVGHSWGGNLAAWIAANPNRYRALIVKAFFSDFATAYRSDCGDNPESCPGFWHHAFGGSPQQVPDVYRANAAIQHIAGAGGAVLLVSTDAFSAEDNARFRDRLSRVKRVPTRLVRYPDESHSVRDPGNQRDLLHRALALFDKHL